MSTETIDRLLTVDEIAELLAVKLPWVYKRVSKRHPNRIPAFKLGK